MCGFAGILTGVGASSDHKYLGLAMVGTLRHRGPDDVGAWAEAFEEGGVALAHTRLAIVDTSAAGHQPMHSTSGRWVLVFNGEIYNHLELRASLEAAGAVSAQWRGNSDTETLLAAIETWGLSDTLRRCVGMWALALWDRQSRQLYLARDRLGEKPLYAGWVAGRFFAFASELKALRTLPGFNNPVCREALAQYLRLGYVPGPGTIYQGIHKLPPGTWSLALPGQQEWQMPQPYWEVTADAVTPGLAAAQRASTLDDTVAISQMEATLSEAVRMQALADVPLGAFLSGGVDSSTIVALLQAQSTNRVSTFTIGFDEVGFDESPYAAAVAAHLGTAHQTLHVTAREARDVIPQLPWMYDEPFADSSQIPTHLVCRTARQQVTVALSGDGGDELFGGYNRYFWAPRIWSKVAWLPTPLRRTFGAGVHAVPSALWDRLGDIAGVVRMGDKAHKLAARLKTVRNIDDLYESLVTEWPAGLGLVRQDGKSGSYERFEQAVYGKIHGSVLPSGLSEPATRMMLRDTLTYLPDDILCKVDRAAMACSLETRAPFLDHRVVELAWRLPVHMKIRGNQGKWALRQVLYKYVPKELIERPKAGFGIPMGSWLCGPLREWAEALLNPKRLADEGYLYSEPITRVWREHLSGRRDHSAKLWAVLMFQSWLEYQRSPITRA
jgi:asparagine synthase (glutamine-hydrolysing)